MNESQSNSFLAEQPVGFGRIAVVGEPLLDADLLAVVAAAVEVVPDFI